MMCTIKHGQLHPKPAVTPTITHVTVGSHVHACTQQCAEKVVSKMTSIGDADLEEST